MKKRNAATRYVRIFADVHEHPAVLTLSGSAFKLWFDLNVQWTGGNNGRLAITPGEQSKRGWNSRSKLARARAELLARRLIKITKYCGPNVYHKATLYALTHLDVAASEAEGIVGSKATHDYRDLRSPESGHQRDPNQVTNVTRIRSPVGENVTRNGATAKEAQSIESAEFSPVLREPVTVTPNQGIQNDYYQAPSKKKDAAAVVVDLDLDPAFPDSGISAPAPSPTASLLASWHAGSDFDRAMERSAKARASRKAKRRAGGNP